jgi:hypothetical protein
MGRIEGEQRIRSGQTFTEEGGVTLRATRGTSAAGSTRGEEGARSRPARGTVRDEFVGLDGTRSTAASPPAVASRHQEIVQRASSLLQQAQREIPGQPREIPSPRAETFQQLVSRQHEHAAHHGAIETAVTAATGGAGGLTHHAAEHAVSAVARGGALVGTMAIESVPAAVTHVALGHGIAGSVASGVAHAALGLALGPMGGGVMTMINSARQQLADGNERTRFQQRASVEDAARASALRTAREHRGAGEVDARFAAAGRSEINWEIFRANGDYAAGVIAGLRQASDDPAAVAYLALEPTVPTRASLP